VDEHGILAPGRPEPMDAVKLRVAQETNPGDRRGVLAEATEGADVFIGVSVPGVLRAEAVKAMARDPIVFAMANPVPEIMPEDAAPHARVMATGRSDYPNQINNVLCFPGFFRGLLDCRAARVTEEMKIAAARAIASVVNRKELHEEYVIPSVFNKKVAPAVAREVVRAAQRGGVARRRRRSAH
jgi:malate dehydrogenase (oxaloacetate-decarboxylating)